MESFSYSAFFTKLSGLKEGGNIFQIPLDPAHGAFKQIVPTPIPTSGPPVLQCIIFESNGEEKLLRSVNNKDI